MGHGYDLGNGRHRAEGVRDLGDGDQLGSVAQEAPVLVEKDLPVIVDRDDLEHGAGGRHQLLPRDDVGVVFEV